MIKVSIFYCENRVIEKVFGRLNYELKKKNKVSKYLTIVWANINIIQQNKY